MADTKITGLQTPGAFPVVPSTDVLPIVIVADNSMAASGSTRKVTVNQLLGAGGTATLASATISGDLTVDTSTLKVDSANNRVGVVQATPLYPLDVTGTVNGTAVAARLAYGVGGSVYSAFRFENTSFSGGNSEIRNYVNGATGTGSDLAFFTTQTGGSTLTERYRFDINGVHTWSNVGGVAGTAMTLNSTGLGVGVTPLGRLHVRQTGSGIQDVGLLENAQAAAADVGPRLGLLGVGSVAMATVESGWNGAANTDAYLSFRTRGSGAVTERLRIDSSGNVGIGVTPSAWGVNFKALEIGGSGTSLFSGAGATPQTYLTSNAYFNGTSWIYKVSNSSMRYEHGAVGHLFYTAPSGTAGNAITFTERLRLKETGQLRFVPLAADPAGAEAGDVYYNSTSNKLKCYNGTTWNDLF